MRLTRWTFTRVLSDIFVPKLFPGAHRYCDVLDGAL